MKKITNGKIFALCLGDFARGLINGIITTYLLTFFIPTNSNTTLPQFFMKAALTMAIIGGFEHYKRHMGRRDARALLLVLDAL